MWRSMLLQFKCVWLGFPRLLWAQARRAGLLLCCRVRALWYQHVPPVWPACAHDRPLPPITLPPILAAGGRSACRCWACWAVLCTQGMLRGGISLGPRASTCRCFQPPACLHAAPLQVSTRPLPTPRPHLVEAPPWVAPWQTSASTCCVTFGWVKCAHVCVCEQSCILHVWRRLSLLYKAMPPTPAATAAAAAAAAAVTVPTPFALLWQCLLLCATSCMGSVCLVRARVGQPRAALIDTVPLHRSAWERVFVCLRCASRLCSGGGRRVHTPQQKVPFPRESCCLPCTLLNYTCVALCSMRKCVHLSSSIELFCRRCCCLLRFSAHTSHCAYCVEEYLLSSQRSWRKLPRCGLT